MGGKGDKMNKTRMVFALAWVSVIVLLAGSFSPSLAIRRAGGQGWGATTLYGTLFDPDSIENLRGKVLSVEKFIPLRQMGWGLLVMVSDQKGEEIAVHVGPGWYLEQQGFDIEPGESVGIRGSRITFNEKPAIIAIEVKKAGIVLQLRNEKGVPVWSEEEEKDQ